MRGGMDQLRFFASLRMTGKGEANT